MNRRPLTPEETMEARRLEMAWNAFRAKTEGATQAWLASAAGLGTQGAVSQYLRGAIPLNLHALLSICRVLDEDPYNISPRLMDSLKVVTEMNSRPRQVQASRWKRVQAAADRDVRLMKVEAAGADDPRFTLIPRVRLSLAAGISGYAVEPEEYDGAVTAVPTEWIERKNFAPADLLSISIRGESMEPTFYEGDFVVLDTSDTKPVDGGVYAVNYEGEPVVKRMMRDAGDWWLVSDNPDQRKYGRKICRGDACLIIGRVVRRETERF